MALAVPEAFVLAMATETRMAFALSLQAPTAWKALHVLGTFVKARSMAVALRLVPLKLHGEVGSDTATPSTGVNAAPPNVPAGSVFPPPPPPLLLVLVLLPHATAPPRAR
jgi:hypothetical protein